jgi:predicted phosphodiesterase
MALYGVVADIHGNREALAAALAELERRGVERLLCLGDIVGYNADPDDCVALLRSRGALAIAGNHDLIALGRLDFARCSNKARYALERTRRRLGGDAASYLDGLPPHRVIENRVVLVHGGVRDVEQYMVSTAHIRENADYLASDFPGARVCFFGHSHDQKVYEVHQGSVTEIAHAAPLALERERTYFINPGSVDASRKRADKAAEFGVLDTDAGRLELLRVPYDCASTEAKAAVFGYRINPWLERLYTLRRRLTAGSGKRNHRRPRIARAPRSREDASRP